MNMREYWANEAAMMRDKSGVLGKEVLMPVGSNAAPKKVNNAEDSPTGIIVIAKSKYGNENLTYRDDKLFTVSGDNYEASLNSFEADALKTLNYLKKTSNTGRAFIEQLQKSSFAFFVQQGDNSKFDTDNPSNSMIKGVGAGGTATWNNNPMTAEKVPVSQNKKDDERNLMMNLAHELLGHGIDAKCGTRNVVAYDSKGIYKLKEAESWASHVENQIRADTGNKLRTKYDYFEIITPNSIFSTYFKKTDGSPYEYKKGNPALSRD